MATYRYNTIKFDRANLAGVDAEAVAGITRYIAARELALNTIETKIVTYEDGPFKGLQVELEASSSGPLPLDFNGWTGFYDCGKWVGTTGASPAPTEAHAAEKTGALRIAKGFEAYGDLFCELAEPIETHTEDATISKTHYACNGLVDDFGQQITRFKRPADCVDDFGDQVQARYLHESYTFTKTARRAVYRIGRATYKILPTPAAVDRLRAKLIKAKRWFSDAKLKAGGPGMIAAKRTRPTHDFVAAVIAQATAAAAIEQAQESAALQELTGEAQAQAAPVACETVQELATVCAQNATSAASTTRSAPQNVGHIGNSTPRGSISAVGAMGKNNTGQAVRGKSGNWNALFFSDLDGRPCMRFADSEPAAFSTGGQRMQALQRLAKQADAAAAQAPQPIPQGTTATAAAPAPHTPGHGTNYTEPRKTPDSDRAKLHDTPQDLAQTKKPATKKRATTTEKKWPARAVKPYDAERIADESGAMAWECFLYQRAGKWIALAYRGKAYKKTAHFSYPTEAHARDFIARFAEQAHAITQRQQQRAAERRAELDKPHSLTVGAVLVSSWGYDQTNVSFYEVTRVIGKRAVEVRAIAAEAHHTGDMQGRCVPMPGQYTSAPMRRLVGHGGYVNVLQTTYGHACALQPQWVAGVKVYPSQAWSSYG